MWPGDMVENKSINLLKGIACLIVVLLHCPFPGIVGDAIIYGIRFSVPIFFMITGYFSYEKNEFWMIRQIKKTLVLIVKGEIFCGIAFVIIKLIRGTFSVIDWIKSTEIIKHPIRILFLGSVWNGTLWYLYALLWTLVILYLIEKYFANMKFLYYYIPILMSIHIIGRVIVQNIGDINKMVFLFRSAILFGVPFVLFGRWIAEYEIILKTHLNAIRCILLFILGIVMEVAEFILYHQYMDLHFSTIIISFALFWWACIHPSEDYLPLLRVFGKRYSMWVYLMHVPCLLIIDAVTEDIDIGKMHLLWDWMKPIIVIMMSLGMSIGIERMEKRRKNAMLFKNEVINKWLR